MDLVSEIINADCIKAMQACPKNKFNLILTDIPYAEVSRPSAGLRNLDKGDADILTFSVDEFVSECIRICSGSIYIFCGTEQVSQIRARMVEQKLSTRLCIWEKTNCSPMNGQFLWMNSIECCVYGKKPKATFNERCKSSVWRYPVQRGKLHPTQKSLKLFEYLVSVSTNENDWVGDFCMGSGTTGVACKKLKRNFIGVDLNSEYCKLAQQRIKECEDKCTKMEPNTKQL